MSYSGSFFAFSLEGDWTNEPHRSPLGPSQDNPSSAIGSKGFKKKASATKLLSVCEITK